MWTPGPPSRAFHALPLPRSQFDAEREKEEKEKSEREGVKKICSTTTNKGYRWKEKRGRGGGRVSPALFSFRPSLWPREEEEKRRSVKRGEKNPAGVARFPLL